MRTRTITIDNDNNVTYHNTEIHDNTFVRQYCQHATFMSFVPTSSTWRTSKLCGARSQNMGPPAVDNLCVFASIHEEAYVVAFITIQTTLLLIPIVIMTHNQYTQLMQMRRMKPLTEIRRPQTKTLLLRQLITHSHNTTDNTHIHTTSTQPTEGPTTYE